MTLRRALVTGATGGLGLALCSALREAGYDVRATGRNEAQAARLTDMGAEFVRADLLEGDLAALCRDIDVVFHAAALSSPWGARLAFQRINVDATRNLLKAARGCGVGSFVFVSSPSIYAAMKDQIGLTETSPLPERALNAYAATKREAENIVLAADAPDFRTVSIRPRALIGPDDAVLLPRILALVSRGWFPLLRDGRALVELTDVRDAAQALVDADRNRERAGGKAINVSGGKPMEMRELVGALGDALGREIALRPLPMWLAKAGAGFSETLFAVLPGKPEP
ncbi:MAG: SDR family NAD(P)-dependent oxidoreductase, partial [Sphingomonadales bacterium]